MARWLDVVRRTHKSATKIDEHRRSIRSCCAATVSVSHARAVRHGSPVSKAFSVLISQLLGTARLYSGRSSVVSIKSSFGVHKQNGLIHRLYRGNEHHRRSWRPQRRQQKKENQQGETTVILHLIIFLMILQEIRCCRHFDARPPHSRSEPGTGNCTKKKQRCQGEARWISPSL